MNSLKKSNTIYTYINILIKIYSRCIFYIFQKSMKNILLFTISKLPSVN